MIRIPRRLLLFASAAFCVSMVGLSAWSIWFDQEGMVPDVRINGPHVYLWLREGRFLIGRSSEFHIMHLDHNFRLPPVASEFAEFSKTASRLPWTTPWNGLTIFLPFWTPAALGVLVMIPVLLTCRKRPKPGHCIQCGYNLTGAAHECCPECGHVLPPIDRATS